MAIDEKEIVDHRGQTVHYTGSVLMGQATGYGAYTDASGTIFTGQFLNDKKHGTGEWIER